MSEIIGAERLSRPMLDLTLQECEDLSIELADMIDKDCTVTGKQYDLLAVIPRGSFGPGNVLSHRLGFDALSIVSASIQSYVDGETRASSMKFGQMPTRDLIEGKDILIVDDTSDTDETLEALRKIAYRLGARSVDAAVLIDKPERNLTGVTPKYSVFSYNGWINFCWEIHNIKGKTSKVRRHSVSADLIDVPVA